MGWDLLVTNIFCAEDPYVANGELKTWVIAVLAKHVRYIPHKAHKAALHIAPSFETVIKQLTEAIFLLTFYIVR